jgi:pantoate--beta-alanine ligase
MGALHAGHLALVRRAAEENDAVLVSVFVNPTQFGANEDLATYPRTWSADMAALSAINAQLATDGVRGRIAAVFAPTAKTMYPTLPPAQTPEGDGTFVTVTPLGRRLEGAARPVFFRGVATVVLKLLNLTTPDALYLGQKDVQQCAVLRRMVRDLHVDTAVRVAPTVREADGLALSSRNAYLGTRRRAVATVLVEALRAVEAAYRGGERRRTVLLAAAQRVLDRVVAEQAARPAAERAGFALDYVSLADPEELAEVDEVDARLGAVLSAALVMAPVEEPSGAEDLGIANPQGKVRLIDNIILEPTA